MNSLEFSIKMELDGEKYYKEQAEKYRNTNLHTIFILLAKDERKHADIIRDRLNQLPPNLSDVTTSFDKYNNIFQKAADFESAIKVTLNQLDVYYLALEKEKESIDLYKEMLSKATDDLDKEVFKFLIEEEKTHYRILEDMVSHISRPEEWVESAEFGLREEY